MTVDGRQIKTRQRVRDLAEVYTHKREVDAMLDLIPDMFPSPDDPGNHDRKFLEPSCGSGNFLEEIVRRKLATVTTARYGRGEKYEHRILRCLASTYGIDIDAENVQECRDRLRALVASHLDNDMNTQAPSPALASAVDAILTTNVIHANTLTDGESIRLVEYRPGRSGTFTREWSYLEEREPDLFDMFNNEPDRDLTPIHYSLLRDNPAPVTTTLKDCG